MSDPTDDSARSEAEARLAEAQAQLAAAEEAYRRVVPCEHRTVSCSSRDGWSCADCGVEVPDPRGCLHHRIDNDTLLCRDCGERMLLQHERIETVLSAPNAVACRNPECSGDIHDPNCDNPDGLYVPDLLREREIPIMRHFTYTCARCRYDGDVFMSGEQPIWDCGHDHHGDSIPIRSEERI